MVRLKQLLARLRPRRRTSWDEVPSGVVLLLAFAATLEAAYFDYVVAKFAPDFIDLVNAHADEAVASPAFWASTIILLGISFQAFIWTMAAAKSSAILQERVFGK
ncbi:hypothetical protein [Sphingomonas adhaesiva]|uniref:hypothetical protein n=1 Tax=Sphingomonas adhaesiva TaxID=28212 RepID=UPI002FF98B3F